MAEVRLTLHEAMRRALAAYEGGQLHEADRLARAILGVKADYFDAIHLIALISARQHRFSEALAIYDRALAVRPDFTEALYNRGVTLEGLKRFEEALIAYDRALAVRPDFVEALHNRGNTLKELKRFDEALASYDRAVAMRPDFVEAVSNRGNALQVLKRFDEALASYDSALAVRPDYVEALNNRGNVLQELKRFDEALASYNRALAMRPDYADALYNRGNTLKELKRFDEALASYDSALAVRPDYVEAISNRGNTLQGLKRFDEALASYDRALAVLPNSAEVHFNRSLLLLLTGDLSAGWREFEWRWKTDQLRPFARDFTQPLWLGESDIEGKTIFIHSEQGFGDAIQFCRYVPSVAARGAHVLLEVPAGLQSIMETLSGVAQLISADGRAPDFDLHCPLLSLPLTFGTRIDSVPANTPYLSVPVESLRSWSLTFPLNDRPRIGLAWSGRPTHLNDANRSIELRSLLPLLDAKASFVSLQKDVRPEDMTVLKARGDLVHLGDKLKTFSDTAAVISNLDLVISVDTSVAHLTGALAKPVWVLLPFVPDWRWLLDREDSPWYPNARLFRQSAPGDWAGVITRVVIELKKLLQVYARHASA